MPQMNKQKTMSDTDAGAIKFLMCVVGTLVIAGTGIYQLNQREDASIACYQIVSDAARMPGLHKEVKEVTADGKITVRECKQVIESQERLLKEAELLITDINVNKK